MSETSDLAERTQPPPTWRQTIDRLQRLPRPLRYPSIIGLGVASYYLVSASDYQVSVLGTGLLIGLAGVGVGMQLRTLRLASLGQGALVGLGAYSILICTNDGWGFVPGILLAIAISIIVGVFMGFGSFRLRTHYFILLTAAIEAVGTACILGLDSLTGGSEGKPVNQEINVAGLTITSVRSMALLILGVCVIAAALAERVYHGRWGRRMLAAGRSSALGRASGVSPLAANVAANVFACLCGAVAGILYAPFIGFLGPQDVSLSLSISCFFAGIICIRTSFFMTLLGGIALQEFTVGFASSGGSSGLFYGLIIVVLGLGLGLQSKARTSGRSVAWSAAAKRYLQLRPGARKAAGST